MCGIRKWMVALPAILCLASAVPAAEILAGTGQNTAWLLLNFRDGAAYQFRVAFDGPATGLTLLDIVESETSLSTARLDFGFGVFIDGFSYDGHANAGYEGGENWWHYWIRENDGPWQLAMCGASDRLVHDGSWDGWVYGRASPPAIPEVPEPAALGALAATAILLRRHRRSGAICRPVGPRSTGKVCAAFICSIAAGSACSALACPPGCSDFATEVVSYEPGIGIPTDVFSGERFDNRLAALGRPTVDTTGDGFAAPVTDPVPVVPVYGPFRATELVTVGQGGHLTLRFDHPVTDDPNNPFGIDLIIFGNAGGTGNDFWTNGDPSAFVLGTGFREEPGIVSVSQDGLTWFTFTDGPFADTFAPTLGRVYDPEHPQAGLWWGQPTDPTLPLDPTMDPATWTGATLAEVARQYGRSAGGTGFDIGSLGLPWIQYVRIDNPLGSGVTPEIDAVADVAAIPEPAAGMLALAVTLLAAGTKRQGALCPQR